MSFVFPRCFLSKSVKYNQKKNERRNAKEGLHKAFATQASTATPGSGSFVILLFPRGKNKAAAPQHREQHPRAPASTQAGAQDHFSIYPQAVFSLLAPSVLRALGWLRSESAPSRQARAELCFSPSSWLF